MLKPTDPERFPSTDDAVTNPEEDAGKGGRQEERGAQEGRRPQPRAVLLRRHAVPDNHAE